MIHNKRVPKQNRHEVKDTTTTYEKLQKHKESCAKAKKKRKTKKKK
jgi:hypothetical protein